LIQHESILDEQALDELIALLREIDEYREVHGESSNGQLLLRDFAHELLRQRLFPTVQFIQLMQLGSARGTTDLGEAGIRPGNGNPPLERRRRVHSPGWGGSNDQMPKLR